MNTPFGAVSNDPSYNLMTRLRMETRAYHTKLESLPYFKALMEHRLPLECYFNQLRALSIIHGVLENEIAVSQDARLKTVWNDDLRKLPLLEADLNFFKPRFHLDSNNCIQIALSMTEKIRLRQIENPLTLLGYLYVFEGSTLGNRMHRTDIMAAYQLREPDGCRYYSSYGNGVRSHWEAFSDKMNCTLCNPDWHDAILEAALETFSGLESLYSALYPLDETDRTRHVTRINPEAGNHPIPEDDREIQAALTASERVWNTFPYYAQRYGKRGKRFSDSDTCWLVTLASLDRESLQKQIDWLCRVLATRGMPSLLMEYTLRYLCEELSAAVPEKTSIYQKLQGAAEALKSIRDAYFPETDIQTLVNEFNAAVGTAMAEAHAGTCLLLLSAVADEKNGITGAVDALVTWLTDANRFSSTWISAVKETIRKASMT